MHGKGEGKIGTVPPANRPPQKHAIQLPKSKEKTYPKKYLFPTRRGQVGPIRNQAGRTKGESRMTENKPKRKDGMKAMGNRRKRR